MVAGGWLIADRYANTKQLHRAKLTVVGFDPDGSGGRRQLVDPIRF